MKVRIIIEKSEETGRLFAKSPDLQGFHAHGADLKEFLRNVVAVLRFIYELRKQPIGDISLILAPDKLDWSVNSGEILADIAILETAAA